MDQLNTHIAKACQTRLPAGRAPFFLGFEPLETGAKPAGYVLPAHRDALLVAGCQSRDGTLIWPDPAGTEPLARALNAQGLTRYRNEAFDIFADQEGLPLGPVLGQIDRGALALLGIAARGAHANGFVRRGGEIFLWVAKRALNKQPDPGKLDHLVAGGVPAGLSPFETLIKEAAEEAGMEASLAGTARLAATLAYVMERPEGLRRDLLFCYDIELPENFVPKPMDGEVEAFSLMPATQVLEIIASGEDFKFNVALVLIDFLNRHGLLPLERVPELSRLRCPLPAG